jgi:SAM-dependent methyltransferase
VTEDIFVYSKLLKDYKNILEFGAGTGRITIPLALEGHNIDAVDIEKNMLKILVKNIKNDYVLSKRIKPILGNMCNYNSFKLYDAIIIPFTSFNYLLTKEDQILCLKSVSNNLKNDGLVIIELLSINTYDDIVLDDEFSFVKILKINETQHYEYYRNTKLDIINKKFTQKRLFKLYQNNQLINQENIFWENRFVTIDDFSDLISGTDLYIDKIYGSCDLKKYNKNSKDIFIKIKKVLN